MKRARAHKKLLISIVKKKLRCIFLCLDDFSCCLPSFFRLHFFSVNTVATSDIEEANNDKFLLYFVFRESALSDLKGEAAGLREAMAKLHSEREDLMQKIQAGEGTNAALQQLKEQNVIPPN